MPSASAISCLSFWASGEGAWVMGGRFEYICILRMLFCVAVPQRPRSAADPFGEYYYDDEEAADEARRRHWRL